MITRTEMYRLARVLDNEYDNEVKPILTEAYETIRTLLNTTIYSKGYTDACKRNNIAPYKFGNLPCDIQPILKGLNITQSAYQGNITIPSYIDSNIVSYLGYRGDLQSSLVDILESTYDYSKSLDADVKALNKITEVKMEFNTIKKCFRKLFVENDGDMFKRMCDSISSSRNFVLNKDEEKDNELYALFNEKPMTKTLKITFTIEEI